MRALAGIVLALGLAHDLASGTIVTRIHARDLGARRLGRIVLREL